MPKEDRSDWVAVGADASSASALQTTKIKPAQSAYMFFQKDVSEDVKSELRANSATGKFNVADFSRLVKEKWDLLDADGKGKYDKMALADQLRFRQESHVADIAALQRRERLQQERNSMVMLDYDDEIALKGKRSTRRQIAKQERKKSRKEKRAIKKEASASKKKQRHNNDDDDEDFMEEDGDGGDDDDEEEEEESSDSYSEESDESSSDDDDSDDSDRPKKKKKKAPPPKRQPTQKQLEYRQKKQQEKEEREAVISERQEDVRKDKADQAKRRLQYLLQQSNIFSHFGQVKQDQAKYGIKSGDQRRATPIKNEEGSDGAAATGSSSSRRDNGGEGQKPAVTEDQELEEADTHQATFLTAQPSTLGFGKMRQYQLEGLNWMIRLQENGVNGILADEMGLGKTLQSISILVYMMEYQNCNGPHLIVVPKSTLSNWMNELKRWAPTLIPVKFHGDKATREDLAQNTLCPGQRDEDRNWHVCVTTYELCNIEKNVLGKFAWSYLIIDEAHRLKNEASAFSLTVRAFETRYRILLTGTPLQNSLHELWALLNFLVPDVFASAEQFDEWFNLDIEDNDEKNRLISQLHKILRPFMLRRLKKEVETSLPPKHETILFTGMSAMQKKLYRDILIRDIDALQGNSGSHTAILNIVMQLRKCAGHPYLFPGVEDRSLPPLGEHLVENCGKMVLLDKLLKRLKERGHRVLLFTQMTRILDIMEDYLVMRRFPYCRIDGGTSYELREDYIDAFNAPNSEKFIFLLSTRAGGLGINLQTADVVILYDSDWNPQADLQAQDRAHRIGQKREVQVFRFVTDHTVEEKIVERAQQKLKLDAMVVQQGRLKEKDKLSRTELLEAVRFGADKIFKSKDSSITDEDIDMILDAGKKKTQEMNEKLKAADKGDLLDFKLDGSSTNLQTFEGVDYSSNTLAAAKAEAELLNIIDLGKRERRTANYNENKLYQQQMAANQGPVKKKVKKKKVIKLPKSLRLPRMEEWQMFDRDRLTAIQEEEEKNFRALPEEVQKMATSKAPETEEVTTPVKEEPVAVKDGPAPVKEEPTSVKEEPASVTSGVAAAGGEEPKVGDSANAAISAAEEPKVEDGESGNMKVEEPASVPSGAPSQEPKAEGGEPEPALSADERADKEKDKPVGPFELPPLLDEATQAEKEALLREGFVKWSRVDYTKFYKSSARYGRSEIDKIALEVGKSKEDVKEYSDAFWSDRGKQRFSDHEYARVIEWIEKGEKKIADIKSLERAAGVLISLFDNPWEELEFTHARNHLNTKDKDFSAENDRYLLCWAHKYGYGHWNAVKMAIRRSPKFRFDYYLRSLPMDIIGRRCETLLRSAEKEVSELERNAREEAGLPVEAEDGSELPPVTLPSFRVMQRKLRRTKKEESERKRHELEQKVEGIEAEMKAIQDRLKELSRDVSDEHKENRSRNGLTAEKPSRVQESRETAAEEEQPDIDSKGAIGPDGEFVDFPEYDGSEEPKPLKKAFTHFCVAHRREVKAELAPEDRKNKEIVNGKLRDLWMGLPDDEKQPWRVWGVWDKKRYARDLAIYEKAQQTPEAAAAEESPVPKKKRPSTVDGDAALAHVPKKKKRR